VLSKFRNSFDNVETEKIAREDSQNFSKEENQWLKREYIAIRQCHNHGLEHLPHNLSSRRPTGSWSFSATCGIAMAVFNRSCDRLSVRRPVSDRSRSGYCEKSMTRSQMRSEHKQQPADSVAR
jgi:hypothetical protein